MSTCWEPGDSGDMDIPQSKKAISVIVATMQRFAGLYPCTGTRIVAMTSKCWIDVQPRELLKVTCT